jgi:hypothetical protein
MVINNNLRMLVQYAEICSDGDALGYDGSAFQPRLEVEADGAARRPYQS